MTDDPNLSARERIRAVAMAEEAEALATRAGPVGRWVFLKLAALFRWCAKDHRDYDHDGY